MIDYTNSAYKRSPYFPRGLNFQNIEDYGPGIFVEMMRENMRRKAISNIYQSIPRKVHSAAAPIARDIYGNPIEKNLVQYAMPVSWPGMPYELPKKDDGGTTRNVSQLVPWNSKVKGYGDLTLDGEDFNQYDEGEFTTSKIERDRKKNLKLHDKR